MHFEDDLNVKRDANGNPDVAYYVNRAERLRSDAIRNLATNAAAGLRRQWQQLAHALHLGDRQPSLHH